MGLFNRCCVDEDYELYIQALTKENMKQLFCENFGGWSDKVSEEKFYDVFNTGFVQLFFMEDSFIGFVSFKEELDYCLIHEIQVLKQFQRKGFGTKMINFVIEKMKASKVMEIRLLVFKNNPSLNFYIEIGFKKLEFIEKSNSYVMSLFL